MSDIEACGIINNCRGPKAPNNKIASSDPN